MVDQDRAQIRRALRPAPYDTRGERRPHVASPAGVAAEGIPSWLKAARALLDEHCHESLRMSSIAAAVGVHPVHLSRVFRQRFGITMMEYRRRLRIARACAALAESRHPLSRVAHATGFSDHGHFTRAFRRAMGMTPSEYRRSLRASRTGQERDPDAADCSSRSPSHSAIVA
jgi:AraC-like DNA-binding protein